MSKVKLTDKEEIAVEELLEKFDFSNAYELFTRRGWTYFDGPVTVALLRETAKRLLERVLKNKSNWVASGRFRASYLEGDHELVLELIFDEESVYVEQ